LFSEIPHGGKKDLDKIKSDSKSYICALMMPKNSFHQIMTIDLIYIIDSLIVLLRWLDCI